MTDYIMLNLYGKESFLGEHLFQYRNNSSGISASVCCKDKIKETLDSGMRLRTVKNPIWKKEFFFKRKKKVSVIIKDE